MITSRFLSFSYDSKAVIVHCVNHPPRHRIALYGAAHIDRHGRCDGVPVLATSNPGRFVEMPGGAAFNVASVLAALGVGVRLHSIAGDDDGARLLHAAAAARGVELDLQRAEADPTASYTAIVGPDGALVVALADMAIYDRFDPAISMDGAGWTLIDANLPPAALTSLARHSPGPVVAMTVSTAKAPRLRDILRDIALLFTNRAELAALCGGDVAAPIGETLAHLGDTDVVVSDGPNSVWTRQGGTIRRWPVPPAPTVTDATGAGDALTAGCLRLLLADRLMDEAIPFGIRVAQAMLAVDGPWRPDLLYALET